MKLLTGRATGPSAYLEETLLEQLFHAVGFGLCHQLPERSFFSGGYQLPVCARDTGIYLGFAVGLLLLAALTRRDKPSELPRWPVLAIVAVFVLAMAVDGVSSYAGWRTTTNDIRLITGLVTGWGLSVLTLPMINGQLWQRPGTGRVPDGWQQTGWWLAGLAVVWAVARWVLPMTGVVYPILVTVSILVALGAVNLVLVGLVPAFERRAARLLEAWLPLVLALGLTVVEVALFAWLRLAIQGWI